MLAWSTWLGFQMSKIPQMYLFIYKEQAQSARVNHP